MSINSSNCNKIPPLTDLLLRSLNLFLKYRLLLPPKKTQIRFKPIILDFLTKSPAKSVETGCVRFFSFACNGRRPRRFRFRKPRITGDLG